MEKLNEELLKTTSAALIVKIVNFKQVRNTYYYTIQLSKAYSNEQLHLEKRFSQFYTLNEGLKNKNYRELPRLPSKTLMPVRS